MNQQPLSSHTEMVEVTGEGSGMRSTGESAMVPSPLLWWGASLDAHPGWRTSGPCSSRTRLPQALHLQVLGHQPQTHQPVSGHVTFIPPVLGGGQAGAGDTSSPGSPGPGVCPREAMWGSKHSPDLAPQSLGSDPWANRRGLGPPALNSEPGFPYQSCGADSGLLRVWSCDVVHMEGRE